MGAGPSAFFGGWTVRHGSYAFFGDWTVRHGSYARCFATLASFAMTTVQRAARRVRGAPLGALSPPWLQLRCATATPPLPRTQASSASRQLQLPASDKPRKVSSWWLSSSRQQHWRRPRASLYRATERGDHTHARGRKRQEHGALQQRHPTNGGRPARRYSTASTTALCRALERTAPRRQQRPV